MTEEQKAIIEKAEEITRLAEQLDYLIAASSLRDNATLFDHVDDIFKAGRRIRIIVRK